eukprot:gene2737-24483_t
MKGGVHGFLLDNTTLLETIVGSLWISTQRGKAYQTRTCGGVEVDLVVVFEHLPCEDDGGLGQLLKAGVDTEAACADRGDLDTVLSGHTAAELARKGGHDDVADAIAAAAAEAQLAPLREALAPGGSSAGHFDSTIGRLLHLLKGVGLSIAETRGFGEDQDLIVVSGIAPVPTC